MPSKIVHFTDNKIHNMPRHARDVIMTYAYGAKIGEHKISRTYRVAFAYADPV